MNRLNNKLIVILLAIALPLSSGLSYAGSRPSGSSGGFRGGFSSQKNVSKPAPSKSSSTGFGSFNTSKPAAGRKSDSALNRDLEKNQAQANAQKSMDARKQANSQTVNASNNQFGRQGGYGNGNTQTTAATGMPPPVPSAAPAVAAAPMPAPAPVVVQKNSGILPAAIVGFMLGGMMSHPQAAESRHGQLEPIANQSGSGSNNGGTVSGQGGGVSSDGKPVIKSDTEATGSDLSLPEQKQNDAAEAGTALKDKARAAAVPVQEEGLGWKLLRLALWSLIIGGFAWVGHKIWRRMNRSSQQDKAAHYSLGGN